MSEEDIENEKEAHDAIVNMALRIINGIAFDMNDNRIDGWVRDHHRNNLILIKEHLDNILK